MDDVSDAHWEKIVAWASSKNPDGSAGGFMAIIKAYWNTLSDEAGLDASLATKAVADLQTRRDDAAAEVAKLDAELAKVR